MTLNRPFNKFKRPVRRLIKVPSEVYIGVLSADIEIHSSALFDNKDKFECFG